MTKPGNALIDLMAEHSQADFPYAESEQVDYWGHAQKITKSPIFTPESFERLPQEVKPDFNWDNALDTDGPAINHTLAWYVPRRMGMQWGVYFDLTRMMAYSKRVHEAVARLRFVELSEVTNQVWSQVLRHELEHCVQELVIAKSISRNPSTSELQMGLRRSAQTLTEAIATHYEFTDFAHRSVNGADSNLTNFVSTQIPLSGDYDMWNKINIDNEEMLYENAFGFFPSIERPSIEFRKLMGGKASSPYITVPTYVVVNARNEIGIWIASCGITERKFASKILNRKFANDLSFDLVIQRSTGFGVDIQHNYRPGNVSLDSKSDQLLSVKKFAEIADLCGESSHLLSERVRYWFI